VLWGKDLRSRSSKQITYSPAYTLVPTYECFNRCTYCNFRVNPGQDDWLSLEGTEQRLRSLRSQPVVEILVLSGEVHPQSPRRAAWIERIDQICDLARSLGFLPHTNAGILSFAEMARLKRVNVSMGLMLEQMTPALLQTVHRHAPSKLPAVRLQQLAWAGELRIPFTTGLLLGLGETWDDRAETLEAIAQVHRQWGHIQEVILQPYSPGQQETQPGEAFGVEELIRTIGLAREILPPEISIQIPPNLVQSPPELFACLEAGAQDLGGISPHDEVNPDYPHPVHAELAETLALGGWELVPRLPIYPQYDDWLEGEWSDRVRDWRTQLQPGFKG
jgi:7,8-didemethyl-8-hydroxy-5-deazariboflavin synthase